jgi:hypothetical protein
MAEPIYSPDGNFIWDGSQWVPVSLVSKQAVDMQNSVIGGDVVSNTNIQSSDAEVIKVAMEGVVASIREMNQPQIGTAPPPLPIAPAQTFSSPIQQNTSSKPFSTKKALVAVSIVGILLLATIVAIIFLRGDDDSHPIIDSWVLVEGNEMITIKFSHDGTVAGYDSDGNEFEERGTWSIDDGSETGGYIDINDLFKDDGEFYYHISKNMLVLHSINDGGNGCDAWVREGYADTRDMRQTEVAIASPPDFCTLRTVD